MSNSPRRLNQMMNSVGHFKDNDIYCLNDKQFGYTDNYNFWTFQEVDALEFPLHKKHRDKHSEMFDVNYIYRKTEEQNNGYSLFIFFHIYAN